MDRLPYFRFVPVAPGQLGAAKPPPFVHVDPLSSSVEDMCSFGLYHGYLDGYDKQVRDSRLEIRLAQWWTIGMYSEEKIAAYGDCYVRGYASGVADRAADDASVQPPASVECTIQAIQTALNAMGAKLEVNGIWGIETEAAYRASGRTCQQLVSSCTQCPGSYVPPTPPTPVPPTPDEEPATKSSVLPWVIGSVIAIGLVTVAVSYASRES